MTVTLLTASLLALTRPALLRRAAPRCCAADDVLDARPSGASAPRGFGGFAPSENVLELPDYFEAVRRVEGLDGEAAARRCCEVLDDRLQLAVSNCGSYGLDEQ